MIRINFRHRYSNFNNPNNNNNERKTTIILATILGVMFSSSFIKKYYDTYIK